MASRSTPTRCAAGRRETAAITSPPAAGLAGSDGGSREGSAGSYALHVFRVPDSLEDGFAAAMVGHGSLGSQVLPDAPGTVRVETYFPPGVEPDRRGLERWYEQGVDRLEERSVAQQDWLAEYRRQAVPFRIGRFLIDPRDAARDEQADQALEPSPDAEPDLLLRIPARNAFGTGSHETTRLVLELLEDHRVDGLRILDVGTGSAILALAALRLGARQVVAFDIDPVAVRIAADNARLNALQPRFFAGTAQALRPRALFDLALVNVLPERIEADLAAILPALQPGARLISSGNLRVRRHELLERWRRLGMVCEQERCAADWVAFVLHREDGA